MVVLAVGVIVGWLLTSKIGRFIDIAALCVLAFLSVQLWGAHKYNAGYSAGSAHERQAWVDQREEDQAKQLAKVAADQRKINQIEADNLALQGQLAETQAALETAIHAEGADQKPAMSKNVAKALNGVGR